MTLEEAQKTVDNWIKTYGVRYFSELTNMAVLTEEVGELARIMARTYGDQSFKEGEKHDLADEMADVLWVLICLANQTGVDLTEAFRKNLEKKTSRDKDRHKNNPNIFQTTNTCTVTKRNNSRKRMKTRVSTKRWTKQTASNTTARTESTCTNPANMT